MHGHNRYRAIYEEQEKVLPFQSFLFNPFVFISYWLFCVQLSTFSQTDLWVAGNALLALEIMLSPTCSRNVWNACLFFVLSFIFSFGFFLVENPKFGINLVSTIFQCGLNSYLLVASLFHHAVVIVSFRLFAFNLKHIIGGQT